MTLAQSRAAFVKELAKQTGLSERVVRAWINWETGQGTVEGGHNYLNVETGGGAGAGPHSTTAQHVEKLSPQAAAAYTASWLRENQPSIVQTNLLPDEAQVEAIEHSGFAESHYSYMPAREFLSAA